ncbi:MAG: hydrogenase maturation nickel metallochaperone HypA [Hyphomicrobiaceae bacterium]|nr:MAG: hydrogenase maturation nickel metallochaperone HypA [Hyphomicrobiaceae bacterium]
MHEMALAEGILQVLEERASTDAYARVRKVWLEIGPLACVEPQALRFSFDVVASGTLAEGADLEIVQTEARAWCLPCAQSVAIAQRFDACPRCGGHQLQVTSGEQLRIKELEVD